MLRLLSAKYSNIYDVFFHLALRYNFDIVREQVNNYGESYDFNSIMHYPFNAFAIDRTRNTILPRDNSILSSARPYRGLSDIDVRQTRKMYKCDGKYYVMRHKQAKFCKDQNVTTTHCNSRKILFGFTDLNKLKKPISLRLRLKRSIKEKEFSVYPTPVTYNS